MNTLKNVSLVCEIKSYISNYLIFLAPAVPHGVPAVKPPIVHQNATGAHPGTPTGTPQNSAPNTPHSPGTLQI